MIFRQKCACVLVFSVSILIVTGCGEFYHDRYEEGYDDGLRDGRIEGYDVGYKEGIIINPIPSSTPTVTIQDLFVYENIKMTERTKGRSMQVSGQITNLTGVEFRFAEFEITLYDANRRIIETDTLFIHSFRPNSTKFFDEWIFVPIEDVRHYSIMFVD